MLKSNKLRKSARGQDCTLRIPGVCSHDPEQTVLCHVSTKRTSAMAGKNHDNFSFEACAPCHAWQEKHKGEPECAQYVLEAMDETNDRRIREGLIKS